VNCWFGFRKELDALSPFETKWFVVNFVLLAAGLKKLVRGASQTKKFIARQIFNSFGCEMKFFARNKHNVQCKIEQHLQQLLKNQCCSTSRLTPSTAAPPQNNSKKNYCTDFINNNIKHKYYLNYYNNNKTSLRNYTMSSSSEDTPNSNNRRLAHQLDSEHQPDQQEQQQTKKQKVQQEGAADSANNTTPIQYKDPASDKDFFIVCKQLERKPSKSSKPQAILRRCKWGYPQVTFIKQTPQRQRSALPTPDMPQVTGTLLWLTCPRVFDLVGKVEHDIAKFNTIREKFGTYDNSQHHQVMKQQKKKQKKQEADVAVAEQVEQATAQAEGNASADASSSSTPQPNPEAAALLIESHKNFEQLLSTLLPPAEFMTWRTGKPNGTMEDEIIRYGNGGSRNALSMKCLHSHVTSFLAGSNDHVGSYVVKQELPAIVEATENRKVNDIEDLSDYLDCPSSCVKCKAYDSQYKQ